MNKPLFIHVRGEIPPHVVPEVDLDRLDAFPIVFAGDLHSHSNTQRNIVYPGSPMTTSFHREEVTTGYITIHDDWTWTWHEFDLPQLIRKTITDPADMILTDFHHTIYEIEGDVADLANVKNSELLDKKVIKRSSKSTLDLKDLTIEEELSEYLSAILNLNDKKMSKKDSFIRACEALNKVSIRDPERILESYPFQLSGGLAQRVVITMAMINKPELLLADEPSTALDVTIQNQALDLMDDLTRETNTAVLLITHNMGVVRKFAEKVYVIYRGVIVEEGTKKQLFKNPGHPYTKALLESIPKLSGDGLPTHDNNPPDYALIPKYVH